LCTDTTEESDELVIKAAAAGVPLILAHTQLRDDLFTDGESAFLCNAEDTIEFSQKLAKFLNSNMLRTQFKENGKYIVGTRLHEDPVAYKLAYRDSIESVFSVEENTAQNKL
jgi:glycosyltransferase involved in cell wall biosynthesis